MQHVMMVMIVSVMGGCAADPYAPKRFWIECPPVVEYTYDTSDPEVTVSREVVGYDCGGEGYHTITQEGYER